MTIFADEMDLETETWTITFSDETTSTCLGGEGDASSFNPTISYNTPLILPPHWGIFVSLQKRNNMRLKTIKYLLLLVSLLISIVANAYDFEVGGIYYNKDGNCAIVTSGDSNYSGDVSIPSTVNYGGMEYSVTSIGSRAFYICYGLTSVTIPNSVTSIGNWAFSGCSGLTSMTIGNSVTSIGDQAFNGCIGLTSVHIKDLAAWCKITFNNSTSNPLYFAHHLYLKGEEIKDLVIPNSVTSIGERAFYYCTDLTSVTIPNSVTSIGDWAFFRCTGLTSVTIPNSVTGIGNSAFCFCSGLTSIKVESGNTTYDSRNDCNAIIETASNTLVTGCKNTVIPNSVTSIEGDAFYGCSGLTSVTIPNSVTSIEGGAFDGCTGLTSVTIPNSVTSIGGQAFYGCSGLTSVTIGNSVTSIGHLAFSNCSGLTSIKVESGNTTYDSRNDCNAIIETASNTLVAGCKNTVIPNSVISIGDYAFHYCSGLTSVTIPNSVTSIGNGAFFYCTGLTSVAIPNSVTSIGDWAFEGCDGLTSIKVESGNPTYDSRNDCNAIILTASNTLVAGCKNTVIPNSVTSIGTYAFEGCSSLTSVTIPNSVTSIGNYAFRECSGLTSVTIPNSVTSIGHWAFYRCSGLTSVTIPNSVTSIGDCAFAYCSNLKSVISEIEIPFTISSYVFDSDTENNGQLTVPKGKKSVYQSTDGWKEFSNIVESAGAVLQSEAPAADEAVDLGLSVKWSPKNLVATTTYEGQAYTFTHFGWGDVTGFNQTDSLRYFPVLHPTVNITGDENRDIAKKLWGDEWRLPNEKEVQELLSCTWTWDAEKGGYTVTGTNGNSIFIEAAGQRELENIKDQSLIGYYWTGVFNKEDDSQAFALRFDNVDKTLEAVRRSLGLAIRPVFGKPKLEVSTTAQMLDYRDEYVSVDSTRAKFQFVYTLEGNIEQAGDYGLLWGEKGASLEIGGSGSHQVKASGTLSEGDNSWTYTLTELTAGKKYEVRTFLMIDDSPIYGEAFAFSTAERFPEPRYVDMGTSVRWAEWNMGAQEAADFGLYFGWGDVAGDMTSTNPYDYAKGFNAADKTIAGNTKYDVAALRWGGKWRMPTEAELLELAENSTWTREERHSATGERISGYLVTSKISGNSIFLPAGGYYEGTQGDRVNSYALYWSGDFDTSEGLPVYYRMNASPIRKTNVKYMRTLIRPIYDEGTNYITYSLSIQSGAGGSVSYDGTTVTNKTQSFTVNEETSATVTITPNTGYKLSKLTVNGTDVTSSVKDNQYTISNISANTTIVATFEQITYTLSVQATGNGSVAYNGTSAKNTTRNFEVNHGTSATLTITPDAGYRLASLTVNGTNVTSSVSNNRYTINSISGNTTVVATFEQIPVTSYSLSIQSGAGGSVSFDGTTITNKTQSFTINEGTSATITITPNTGYKLSKLTVNGTNVTSSVSNNKYTINSISANTTVVVTFEQITYSLSVQATGNGTVTYNSTATKNKTNSFTVNHGSSATLSITPDSGYRLASLTVNGTDVTSSVSNNQYTISNITANTTVVAMFEQIPVTTYSLSIQSGAGGSVSYDGTTITNKTQSFTIAEGSSVTIEMTPNTGYKLLALTVNGNDVTASVTNNQYTISNITGNTTVVVTFKAIPQSITQDGINYVLVSADDYTLNVGKGNYSGHVVIPATVSYDGDTWTVAGVVDGAFNLSAITAITWNPNAAIGDGAFGAQTNPNLLLYVKTEAYAPSNVQNVIANGRAKKIILTEAASGNDFNCPVAFTAEEISYSHRYGMTTGIGECRGWETIALPFDVKQFTHESKGTLIPFKVFSSTSTGKPFWLYRLTASGWQEAANIEANTPYIISLPNNKVYDNDYNLPGVMTFSSSNVTVPVTEAVRSTYGDRTFVANFTSQASSWSIYALNVNNDYSTYSDYLPEGSTFIRELRTVHPFEAYMTNSSGNAKQFFPLFETLPTAIREIPMQAMRGMKGVRIYSMSGELIMFDENISIEEALKQLKRGVYFVNGKKMVVK